MKQHLSMDSKSAAGFPWQCLTKIEQKKRDFMKFFIYLKNVFVENTVYHIKILLVSI